MLLVVQLLATSVKQMRQQEQQARLSGSGSPVLLDPLEGFSSGTVAGPEANPFLSDAKDAGGSFWDPGDGGGYSGISSAGRAGGSSSSPAWGSRRPPLQQQQQLAGTRWQASGCSLDGAGVGSMGPRTSLGGASSGGRDEQFGSLHETGQVSIFWSLVGCLLAAAQFTSSALLPACVLPRQQAGLGENKVRHSPA